MSGNPRSNHPPADSHFMRLALGLGAMGRGWTEPNPLVGAVVVKNERILATGFHACFGGMHAERMALENVRERGTTLYVTLEPCCHFGKTPPCTDLLIEKSVRRVVVAMPDPNPVVNGRGLAILKKHGIQVSVGLLGDAAAELNRHYLIFIRQKRPYVAVHAGMSLDGKLSDRQGRSQWVTSAELRMISHSLRGEFSAILAGRGTVELDNPRLTIRDPHWRGRRLFRVVLDPPNLLSPGLRIFQEQELFPLVLFSSRRAKNKKKKTLLHYFVDAQGDKLDLFEVCGRLHELGIASMLVEGGARVIDSFIQARLVDEFFLFFAPKIVGGRSAHQLYATGANSLAEAVGLGKYRLLSLATGFVLQGVL